MSAIYFLWTLHIVILPIYVFGSGSIQPSHLVFLTGFVLSFLVNNKPKTTDSVLSEKCQKVGRVICLIFTLFSLYATLVGTVWSAILGNFIPLMFSSFQLYNLLLIYFVYRLAIFDIDLFFKSTRIGFFIAVLLVLVSVFISGFDSASREEGLFNNPNQLAFFCLSSCLVFFISDRLAIGSLISNRLMIGISCFLCLLTLSRAGLVTCGIILIFTLLSDFKKIGGVVFTVLVAGFLIVASSSIALTDRLKARNDQTQAVFSNQVEGRGYDRILHNPEYLLFGASEGENRRFGGYLASIGGEIHSSVGTLLFCYGAIGFSFYCGIWYLMFSSYSGLAFKACALAPIVYGVSHNGLRFSAAMIAVMLMIYGGTKLQHIASRPSRV